MASAWDELSEGPLLLFYSSVLSINDKWKKDNGNRLKLYVISTKGTLYYLSQFKHFELNNNENKYVKFPHFFHFSTQKSIRYT
jgi:hypothetical protein